MESKTDRIHAKNGQACVITYRGQIVLQPEVSIDELYYPSYGFIKVKKDGKYGFLNEDGAIVIPCQFEWASDFSENGLAFAVDESGLGGYIDKTGNCVIDPIYETGTPFKLGFAAVSQNGKYIYIRKNGMRAINGTFKYAGAFSDCGLAKFIKLNGEHGFIDTAGLTIISMKHGNELEEFQPGTRVTKFHSNGRESLINAAGDIITRFYDEIVIAPYARLHPFLKKGLWGYLNNLGEEVIPNIYLEASPFTEGNVAYVKAFHPLAEKQEWEFYINEKDDIVDREKVERETEVYKRRFAQITPFKGALALAIKKGGDK